MILLWYLLFIIALAIDQYIGTTLDTKFNTGFQLLFRTVVIISLIYYNVQDSDWFIRISDYERWQKIEQKKAEETKESKEWFGVSPYQQIDEYEDTGETCYDRAGPYDC